MARTTVDIADPVLRELRALQRRRGVTLGQLVTDLLLKGLAETAEDEPVRELRWHSRNMGEPRVPLEDKEALHRLMDGGDP